VQPFREVHPKRTCIEKHENYRFYKSILRTDFNKHCGYCDDWDFVCGGARGFHIDHFRPKKKFEHLENDYNNLVYACPYCNGAKSDDWPSNAEQPIADDKGYVDPCDNGFTSLFNRFDNGRIFPKSKIGSYMFKQLKLGLRRHQLAWMYERLGNLLQEVTNELEKFNEKIPEELSKNHIKLTSEYLRYKNLFQEIL